MNETVAPPAADKTAIRTELEATHAAYKELISQLPDAKWSVKSGNPAWTCGQLAWHLASGLDFSAGIVENAGKGKQTSVPSFLMPIAYKLNEIRVRRASKKATRDSVLADYERDQARLVALLEGVTEADLAVVKTNFALTQTVGEMFRIPVEHFAEHGPEIRSAL